MRKDFFYLLLWNLMFNNYRKLILIQHFLRDKYEYFDIVEYMQDYFTEKNGMLNMYIKYNYISANHPHPFFKSHEFRIEIFVLFAIRNFVIK